MHSAAWPPVTRQLMKQFFWTISLVGLSFLAISCGAIHVYHVVTLDEMEKKPPFDATIENKDISRPFFVWTAADVYMRRVDNGKRFDLQFFPAGKNTVKCVRSLQIGELYSFPQVMIGNVDTANATELRKRITGTWKIADSFEMTLAENGGFVSRSAGLTNTLTNLGTWTVQNGDMISTITNSSTQGPTNRLAHFVVLRLNDTDLVLSGFGSTAEFKRIK